jgi:hypothetical protein
LHFTTLTCYLLRVCLCKQRADGKLEKIRHEV